MMSMGRSGIILLLLATASAQTEQTASTSVTPVQEVITLLEDLQATVQTEGSTEAQNYDTYACFCKDATAAKSTSITEGQDNIGTLSAEIEDKTAQQAEKETELAERKTKQEQLQADLAAATAQYQKDQAEYEATSADLTKAISSLESAIQALESAKPGDAPVSLIAVREKISSSLAIAEALQIIGEQPSAVGSFLQGTAKVDPSDPEYKYHSQPIIDLCQKLLGEFQDKKSAVDSEWAKTHSTYESTKQSIEDEMSTNSEAMGQLSTDIDELKTAIASARTDLINAEAMLKDDQLYLKDLTTQCEARAKDWDQRSQMRNGELKAISEALTVLKDEVKGLDSEVNQRALLQVKPVVKQVAAKNISKTSTGKTLSFLQLPAAAKPAQKSGSFLARSASGLSQAQRTRKAIDALGREGKRLNSAILTSLTFKLANDPFLKVKKLIQTLVERLLAEATAEASKKGFCDTELGKANNNRDARFADTKKLSTELAALEVKQDELEAEIDELTIAINQTQQTLEMATSQRASDKEANMETIAKAKQGLEAVKKAIVILKSFYKEASKAKVFLQASPVDEDTQGPGFEGAYSGKQESATGVVGLLEVIASDFERTIKTVTKEEKTGAADFVEFDRTSKSDISGKSTKKELDEQDLESTRNTIATKMTDLQTAQDLLDKALQEIEALKPMCIDSGMTYSERVAQREEEINALKSALCILDTDGVEPDCASQ